MPAGLESLAKEQTKLNSRVAACGRCGRVQSCLRGLLLPLRTGASGSEH